MGLSLILGVCVCVLCVSCVYSYAGGLSFMEKHFSQTEWMMRMFWRAG